MSAMTVEAAGEAASETEKWLPVPGWEDRYQVSDMGRLRSLTLFAGNCLRPGRILKPALRRGYESANLCRDYKRTYVAVHRLVLLAFVGPCPAGMNVRHGPGGRRDNRLANLSYGTFAQNTHDMIRDHTVSRRGHLAVKLTPEIVIECRRRYAAGESPTVLANEFGVGDGTMVHAVTGKSWASLSIPGVRRTPLPGLNSRGQFLPSDSSECSNGHARTPENTYVKKSDGRPRCRPCATEASQRHRARKHLAPGLAAADLACALNDLTDGTTTLTGARS